MHWRLRLFLLLTYQWRSVFGPSSHQQKIGSGLPFQSLLFRIGSRISIAFQITPCFCECRPQVGAMMCCSGSWLWQSCRWEVQHFVKREEYRGSICIIGKEFWVYRRQLQVVWECHWDQWCTWGEGYLFWFRREFFSRVECFWCSRVWGCATNPTE